MASFERRGDNWRAHVFKAGQRATATFDTKREAEDWATKKEAEILAGLKVKPSKSLHDVLDHYIGAELPKRKDGGKNDLYTYNKLKREIQDAPLRSDELVRNVAEWRDATLKRLKPSSVRRYMTLLTMACEVARRDLKWIDANPMKEARKPKAGKARDRTLTQTEIDIMLGQLDWQESIPTTPDQEVALAMLIGLECGMRSIEIIHTEARHIRPKVVFIPDSKNSDAREVPLSGRARELWALVPNKTGCVFNLTDEDRDQIFRKARIKAGLKGFTFHDTRATAITRLAKTLDILSLAKMIGHRDLKSLMIYYRESSEDIADRLG